MVSRSPATSLRLYVPLYKPGVLITCARSILSVRGFHICKLASSLKFVTPTSVVTVPLLTFVDTAESGLSQRTCSQPRPNEVALCLLGSAHTLNKCPLYNRLCATFFAFLWGLLTISLFKRKQLLCGMSAPCLCPWDHGRPRAKVLPNGPVSRVEKTHVSRSLLL